MQRPFAMKALAVVLPVLAGVLLFRNCRAMDPQGYVGDIVYDFRCMDCDAKASIGTQDLNAMKKRGDYFAPDRQLPRFKCPECGKISLIADESNVDALYEDMD
jgi:predicted RNA-binding Zn-ribbon protein involved in translation (DUF1610 family)